MRSPVSAKLSSLVERARRNREGTDMESPVYESRLRRGMRARRARRLRAARVACSRSWSRAHDRRGFRRFADRYRRDLDALRRARPGLALP